MKKLCMVHACRGVVALVKDFRCTGCTSKGISVATEVSSGIRNFIAFLEPVVCFFFLFLCIKKSVCSVVTARFVALL